MTEEAPDALHEWVELMRSRNITILIWVKALHLYWSRMCMFLVRFCDWKKGVDLRNESDCLFKIISTNYGVLNNSLFHLKRITITHPISMDFSQIGLQSVTQSGN